MRIFHMRISINTQCARVYESSLYFQFQYCNHRIKMNFLDNILQKWILICDWIIVHIQFVAIRTFKIKGFFKRNLYVYVYIWANLVKWWILVFGKNGSSKLRFSYTVVKRLQGVSKEVSFNLTLLFNFELLWVVIWGWSFKSEIYVKRCLPNKIINNVLGNFPNPYEMRNIRDGQLCLLYLESVGNLCGRILAFWTSSQEYLHLCNHFLLDSSY